MNLPPLQKAEEPYNALNEMIEISQCAERCHMTEGFITLEQLDAWIAWMDEELRTQYDAGYTEGFYDGYSYFPDLGHGKVAGE